MLRKRHIYEKRYKNMLLFFNNMACWVIIEQKTYHKHKSCSEQHFGDIDIAFFENCA